MRLITGRIDIYQNDCQANEPSTHARGYRKDNMWNKRG